MKDKFKIILLSAVFVLMTGYLGYLFFMAIFPVDPEQERIAPFLEKQRKNIAEYYKNLE